jgi:hypothetical protein
MSEYNSWQSSIIHDIEPFSDPRTEVRISVKSDILKVEWTSWRRPLFALFESDTEGQITVNFENEIIAYDEFLASPYVGDLTGLANMMAGSHGRNLFIDTLAYREDEPDKVISAIGLLEVSLKNVGNDCTKVVFVNGDAGVGKTRVLQELVRRQADGYLKGTVKNLFLYVDAQGRALARLDEALATELQDLRARLTYHAVPTLVRNGILTIIVDGFDELLGVLGYEDAFSSLRRFLDQLDGRGALLASARSTYYQQEFLSRTVRADFVARQILIDPVAIQPWEDEQFEQFVERKTASLGLSESAAFGFANSMRQAFQNAENIQFKTKPFFVDRIADLILSDAALGSRSLSEHPSVS